MPLPFASNGVENKRGTSPDKQNVEKLSGAPGSSLAIGIIDNRENPQRRTILLRVNPGGMITRKTEGHSRERKLLSNQAHITGWLLQLITLRGSSAKGSYFQET